MFSTIHGSRLYGLNHADSDNDRFELYWGKRRARQKISGKEDVLAVSWDQFYAGVTKGVPQYLEALYSPYKACHMHIPTLRPGYESTITTYLRTIFE